MGPLTEHSKCHKLCPELPFSMVSNILLSSLFLLHLPFILVAGPLLYIIYSAIFSGVPSIYRHYRMKMSCCPAIFLTCFLTVIGVVPLSLVGGSIASCLITLLGIFPLFFWTISYILRLLYHYNRLICCN